MGSTLICSTGTPVLPVTTITIMQSLLEVTSQGCLLATGEVGRSWRRTSLDSRFPKLTCTPHVVGDFPPLCSKTLNNTQKHSKSLKPILQQTLPIEDPSDPGLVSSLMIWGSSFGRSPRPKRFNDSLGSGVAKRNAQHRALVALFAPFSVWLQQTREANEQIPSGPWC